MELGFQQSFYFYPKLIQAQGAWSHCFKLYSTEVTDTAEIKGQKLGPHKNIWAVNNTDLAIIYHDHASS